MSVDPKICGIELAEVTSTKRIAWDQSTVRSFYQLMARERLSKHIRPSANAINELWVMKGWARTPADKVQLVVCKILRWLENHIPDFVREEQRSEDLSLYTCYWPQQALQWTAEAWDGQTEGVATANVTDWIANTSRSEYLSLQKATAVCSTLITGQVGLELLQHNDMDMYDVEEVLEHEQHQSQTQPDGHPSNQKELAEPDHGRVGDWISYQREHGSRATEHGQSASPATVNSTRRQPELPTQRSVNQRSHNQTNLSRRAASTYVDDVRNRPLMRLDISSLDQLTLNDFDSPVASRLQYPHQGRSLTRACFREPSTQVTPVSNASPVLDKVPRPEKAVRKHHDNVRHDVGRPVAGSVQGEYQNRSHTYSYTFNNTQADTANKQNSVSSTQEREQLPAQQDSDSYRNSYRSQEPQRVQTPSFHPRRSHRQAMPSVSESYPPSESRIGGSQTPRPSQRQHTSFQNTNNHNPISAAASVHTSPDRRSEHHSRMQSVATAGGGWSSDSVSNYAVSEAARNHHLNQQEAADPVGRALKRAENLSRRQNVDDRVAAMALVLGSVLWVRREAEPDHSRQGEVDSMQGDFASEVNLQEEQRSIHEQEAEEVERR